MINAGKKFPNITLQYPSRSGMVFANPIRKFLKSVHCLMYSFFVSARKRFAGKSLVEKWIERLVNRVVQDPIPDSCFVYLARLGVGYGKHMIAAMFISIISQVFMEADNVIE